MSYIPYTTSSTAWNNLQGEKFGKTFYPLQKGEGSSSIKIVSPVQGSVQRAKSELKRQLTESELHSPPSKRRKKISTSTSSNKKKKKKKKPNPKSSKKKSKTKKTKKPKKKSGNSSKKKPQRKK